MIAIPAIDLIDGALVRLSAGDYSTAKGYGLEPADAARMIEDAGLTHLHLVDLDGAKASHVVNYKTLEQIAGHTSLTIDFGGGVKSDEDLHIAFESGAHLVTGGSIAVRDRDRFAGWIEQYGKERIILGADVRDGKISTGGWLDDSDVELIPFVRDYMQAGIEQVITTDIARDGMLQGCSVELYRKMLAELPGIYLIASGGVGSWFDIEALQSQGIPAVILGKAIYEGHISLDEIARFITHNN